MTIKTIPKLNEKVRAYLVKRDGRVRREGKAMLLLVERTGYGIEALRSFAYDRRHAVPDARRSILRKLVWRG